ncbi:hypothetical protein HSE3_gp140 [Bacillus phage vB_BceM-HSE3]|nr:hypothetical protein HSE3_gp140 [Bacillus phage vB_BceM-HSE3]
MTIKQNPTSSQCLSCTHLNSVSNNTGWHCPDCNLRLTNEQAQALNLKH